ncbi:HNH endonuclease signature motif containing protein, partial [Leucobacter sp. HY1908]
YAIEETPTRLQPIAKRLAEEYAEVSLDERHAAARKRRRIEVVDREDGMAKLYAYLPAEIAYAIKDRVQRIAKQTWTVEVVTVEAERQAAAREDAAREAAARAAAPQAAEQAGEASQAGQADQAAEPAPSLADQVAPARTLDEVRADTLAELLLNGNPYTELDVSDGSKAAQVPSGFFAHVQVMVPIASIPATADLATDTSAASPRQVCELVGYGPIASQIAHDMLALSRNVSRVDEDEYGNVLCVDRYKPTRAMRNLLWARDRRCRFPGCTRLPITCDMDHTIAWEHGGPTTTTNLQLLCKAHHSLKHGTDWRPVQDRTGTVTWKSPTGRVHTDRLAGRRYPRPDTGPENGQPGDLGPDPWDEAPAVAQEFSEFLWWRQASTEADRPKPADTTPADTTAPKREVRFVTADDTDSTDGNDAGTGDEARSSEATGDEATDCRAWHSGFTVRDRLTALEKHAITCGCNYPEFCDRDCGTELRAEYERRAARSVPKEQPF